MPPSQSTQQQLLFLNFLIVLIALVVSLLYSWNPTPPPSRKKETDKDDSRLPENTETASEPSPNPDEKEETNSERADTDVTDSAFIQELEEFSKNNTDLRGTKITNAKSSRISPPWLKLINTGKQKTRLVFQLFKHIFTMQNDESFRSSSGEHKKRVINTFMRNFRIYNKAATPDNVIADIYCTFQLLAPHDTDLKYSFQSLKVLSKFISKSNDEEMAWLDNSLQSFHKRNDTEDITDADITDICNPQKYAIEAMGLDDAQSAMDAVDVKKCSFMVHTLYKHMSDFFKNAWTTSSRATAFVDAKKDLDSILRALDRDNLKPLFTTCMSIILGNLKTGMRFATLSNYMSPFGNSIFFEYRLCSDFAKVIRNYTKDIQEDNKERMFAWRMEISNDLMVMGPRLFHYVRPHLCSSSKHHVGLSYIDNGNVDSDSFRPSFSGFVQNFPDSDSSGVSIHNVYVKTDNKGPLKSLPEAALRSKKDAARTTAHLLTYCCAHVLGNDSGVDDGGNDGDDGGQDTESPSVPFELHLWDRKLKQRIHFNVYHSPIFWLDKKKIDDFLRKRGWSIIVKLRDNVEKQTFKSDTVTVRHVKEFDDIVPDNKSLWVEQKYDGFRLQLHVRRDDGVKGHQCQFYTKNGYDQTERYKLLVALCVDHLMKNNSELDSCILDGELVVYDIKSKNYSAWGKENLTASQEKKVANYIILNRSMYQKDRLPGGFNSDLLDSDFDGKEPPVFEIPAEAFTKFISKSKANIALYLQNYQLCFVAFDILHYNGRGLLEVPFSRRRRLLSSLISPALEGRLEISAGSECHNMQELHSFMLSIATQNGEGVILKRNYHPYSPAKKVDWNKIKFLSTDYDTAPVGGGFRVTSNVFNMFHVVCALPSQESGVRTWKTVTSCFGFMNATADAARFKAKIMTHETFELVSAIKKEFITKNMFTKNTENYEITYTDTMDGQLQVQYIHQNDSSRNTNVLHAFNSSNADVQFICHPCACDDGVINIIGDYRIGTFKETGGRFNQNSPYTSDICVRFPAGRFRDKTDKTWEQCNTLDELNVDTPPDRALRNSSISSLTKTAYSANFRDLARLFRMYASSDQFTEYKDIESIADSFTIENLLDNIDNDTKVTYPHTAKRIDLRDIKDKSKSVVTSSLTRKLNLITRVLSIVLPQLDQSSETWTSLMDRYRKLFGSKREDESEDDEVDNNSDE